VLLWAAAAFADCKSCHPAQVLQTNAMSKAMEFVEQCGILRRSPDLSFNAGPYRYRIVRKGSKSIYERTDGRATVTVPV